MFEQIPQELKQLDQWTCYKLIPRDNGKPEKRPVNPVSGNAARSNDPFTWVSFDMAVSNSANYDGIGFFFSESDDYCGIDIDDCFENPNGNLPDHIQKIVEGFASYTEISPSKSGIHIILNGKIPEWSGHKKKSFEAYDQVRFFTMTGQVYHDFNTISSNQEYLESFCREYLSHEQSGTKPDHTSIDGRIQKALSKDNTFYALWHLGYQQTGYQSASEADLALCQKLIHILGPDPDQLEIQMKNSPNGREKYDKSDREYGTYLKRTIHKALETHQQKSPIDEHIEELNTKHAVVLLNGQCVIINEMYDPLTKNIDVSFSKPADFKNYYSNLKFEYLDKYDQLKTKYVANEWLSSSQRRQYKGVVFSPDQDFDGYYNLFKGFHMKPQQGDWSLFQKHIYEVLSNSNDEIYQYLLSWMAHGVKYPGYKKPGVAIVLKGKQGTGKSTFAKYYGKLFEPHFLHLSSSSQLTGRFNSFLKDKILVYADEAVWTGDKHAAGILKTMITEDTIFIEPKGKNGFSIQNHIRLIISSNNDWVIPAGMEERRFCMLELKDTYIQDQEYFRAIIQQMENGGCEAMLSDLQDMDIRDFDFSRFPRTNSLMSQIERSMPPEYQWWYERLLAGTQVSEGESWVDKVLNEILYEDYKNFITDSGFKRALSRDRFGRVLNKICPQIRASRYKDNSGNQKPCKIFPELQICRSLFESLVSIPIDWENN